jgi:signal transduction histidine kinase
VNQTSPLIRRSSTSKRRRLVIPRRAASDQASAERGGIVRVVAGVRRWIAENSFVPPWLPEPVAHPLAGYVLAVALVVVATLVTLALVIQWPSFSFPGTLNVLAVALAALSWGGAPSLVATVIGTILLETVVLPHTLHGGVGHVGDVMEIGVSLGVGAIISVAASRTEQGRRRAVRKTTEAEARELVLRETNARTDEFLSIASHELRSPLTSLKAALQLSERRLRKLGEHEHDGDDEAQEAQIESIISLLDTAEHQVDRQNRLVGDLLDVSRIRANKLEYRLAPSDLAAIVRDAVDEQRLSWPGREMTLEAPSEAVPVRADAQRIGQVVTNYLTNALKYSPPDASVHVSLRVDGGEARVAVRDQGPGLSAAQQRHIWERFHRVPGVRQQSGAGAGLGLGLHISRMIIEHHGGRVGIESVPRRGSTFWFTLPLSTQ